VRQGDPAAVLAGLCRETGANQVFAEADVSPYARRRDAQVARACALSLVPGLGLHPPEALTKADGAPYKVFTPFSHRWQALPFPGSPIPAPQRMPAPPPVASLPIPEGPALPTPLVFPAGETEAQRRLENFLADRIAAYAGAHDRVDLEGTSQLSPYLRFGMLSARQAAWAARQAEARAADPAFRQGAEAWLNELAWRDFYLSILFHFPFVRRRAFRPAYRNMPWREDPAGFAAWSEGRTGYPLVDAAMRQLNQTGWMHNRARMIVASFLTKDLLIDWRAGERYFMQHLLDGDPAANNGGWQWVAGTGTDAAPYFRVFNPVLQSIRFDPRGETLRRWLPELRDVPDTYLHTPWKMPSSLQIRSGCRIGETYPAPIVEHAMARQRALLAYQQTHEK